MRNHLLVASICGLVLAASSPALAESVTAAAALEQLKSMAGTWTGTAAGEGEAAEAEAEQVFEAVHEIQLSAAGTVVMETMGPGTPYEMINMYHLDGDDLVLTHYCAGGNQPRMRLDREASSADRLVFDFDGGTNLDPAVDQHIHSAELQVIDGDHVVSDWSSYAGGSQAGRMTFSLQRSE